MRQGLLVLNAGSSSLKFALFDVAAVPDGDPVPVLRGQIEGIGTAARFVVDGGEAAPLDHVSDHEGAIAHLLDWLDARAGAAPLAGAGHRVVHGGTEFTAPMRVDEDVIVRLTALEPLAPHHQPHNLAAIRALATRRPALAQVACFDTAFHAGQPEVATRLALPDAFWRRGVRRYGFHGLSYEYVVEALPRRTGAPLPERLVIAHLGNGASMCAVLRGRSVATTMGFSTLDGLPMGTRCGALDPGVVLHLMREEGMDLDALTGLLYDRSGLLALSGLSADMRTLLASDAPDARRAVDVYCYRIARELGSLAAALGGLDALVFTGGVGENAPEVRARVCRQAAWLGLAFDEAANLEGSDRISAPDSPVAAWVVATNEEAMIARHAARMLA